MGGSRSPSAQAWCWRLSPPWTKREFFPAHLSVKLPSNFPVLMLKRSSKSKFMPNAYVFPGWVISGAGFASWWKDHFKDSGYNDDDIEELVLKNVKMLMKAEIDESISRDIALRWCLDWWIFPDYLHLEKPLRNMESRSLNHQMDLPPSLKFFLQGKLYPVLLAGQLQPKHAVVPVQGGGGCAGPNHPHC